MFAKKEINIFGDDETKINIKDEDVNKEDVELKNENVPALYYLRNRYEIPSLMKETEQFIQENNLSLQFLLFYQNYQRTSLTDFIEQLSDNFFNYIHNKTILDLNFPILYQVIEKVKSKRSLSEIYSNDFINFLFDCLDKYLRPAFAGFHFFNNLIKNKFFSYLRNFFFF